jgi:LysR family transcriptional regulator (chromosome initiation inhibitor)
MVTYNRRDALQARFITKFTPDEVMPPTHCVPSSVGFVEAAARGMGWGMVPEQLARSGLERGELAEIAPGHFLDVPLFWQRWRLKSEALELMSAAVRLAARQAGEP